ncbi:hypothetical protein CJ468_06481 [Nocardia farcinica]|nr:hypothetical protein CJ468_06481 [Nocardia farcinica]
MAAVTAAITPKTMSFATGSIQRRVWMPKTVSIVLSLNSAHSEDTPPAMRMKDENTRIQ